MIPLLEIRAPLSGETVALGDVPDPVFAAGMLGEGIAIDPESGVVRSPVDGEVSAIFHTHHALAIRTSCGIEVLVHVGLETARLDETFTSLVAEGQRVRTGEVLLHFDLDSMRRRAQSALCPLVITALPPGLRLEASVAGRAVTAGVDTVLTIFREEGGAWSN